MSPTQQIIDQIIAESQAEKRQPNVVARPPPKPPLSPPPRDFDFFRFPDDRSRLKPDKQAENGRIVWPPKTDVPAWKTALLPAADQPNQPKTQKPLSQQPAQQPPKRPLDTDKLSRPEKRTKLDSQQSPRHRDALKQKPANASSPLAKSFSATKSIPTKLNPPAVHPEPMKHSKSPSTVKEKQPLQSPFHATSAIDAPKSKSGMPIPLLSPNIRRPPQSPDRESESIAGKESKSTLPSSTKSNIPDVGKAEHNGKVAAAFSPEEPVAMPSLLSPLSQSFMKRIRQEREEMSQDMEEGAPNPKRARIEGPATAATANTVGARRERSRQPDAPGVARKTTKTHTRESSTTKDVPGESNMSKSAGRADDTRNRGSSNVSERRRKVVKLKYGKRHMKTIGRILQMKARPLSEAKVQLAPVSNTPTTEIMKHARSNDGHDEPSTKRIQPAPTSNPSTSENRKHARPDDERDEPSTKRAKGPASLDIQSSHTPVTPSAISPALSAPDSSQKPFFGTPKKGDSIKSVAMRRVESSDGRGVQTPQGARPTSAPTSVERSRVNGISHNSAEIEALEALHNKLVKLGQDLKRRGDQVMQLKVASPGPVTDDDMKLGIVYHLESVIAFMVAFHASDTACLSKHKPRLPISWKQLVDLLRDFTRRAVPYGELHTLCHMLGAVIRNNLSHVYSECCERAMRAGDRETEVAMHSKDLAMNTLSQEQYMRDFEREREKYGMGSALTVAETKGIALRVLENYCMKNGLAWEKKME